jgi:hypothetical protein
MFVILFNILLMTDWCSGQNNLPKSLAKEKEFIYFILLIY